MKNCTEGRKLPRFGLNSASKLQCRQLEVTGTLVTAPVSLAVHTQGQTLISSAHTKWQLLKAQVETEGGHRPLQNFVNQPWIARCQ